MIENQRYPLSQYATPANLLSLAHAVLVGFIVLLAGLDNRLLLVATLYLVLGLVGIVARRYSPAFFSKRRNDLLLLLINAIGLLVVPGLSIELWMGLAGLSLLSMLSFSRHQSPWDALLAGMGLLVGAVVGAFLGLDIIAQPGYVLTAWGVLLTGTAAATFAAIPPHEGTSGLLSTAEEHQVDLSNELRHLGMSMRVTVEELVSAAQAINEVTTQQASGANEQANVIRTTTDHLQDFLQLSEQIKQEAHNVRQTAQETANISAQGQDSLEQAIAAMDDIREQVTAIGGTIVTLAQLTQRVDQIIASVSEIATQSNLLALNASIEAARAGVHGRGFAVVADEVRALSQQSTQSAQQVRLILAEIQQAMKETVRATEIGMEGVDAGVVQTRDANTVMVKLAESVNTSQDAIQSIYDVIRQQTEGLEEIAISMERINRITQQHLGSTRTVEMVSGNLTRLASNLQSTVDQSQGLEMQQVGSNNDLQHDTQQHPHNNHQQQA